MKKITVIIPVYNAGASIGQCVRSLLGQTYPEWEALLIDDGSTDQSPALCEEWGRADSRIKVYHQRNRGVSAARNAGLDRAGGEYVFFLDSDDAIHPLLLEEMLRQMEKYSVQMAFCAPARLDDRQLEAALAAASPLDARPQWQIGNGQEAERWFHIDHEAALCGISGMMARRLIGPLRFDETLSFGEDTLFKYALFRQKVPAAYTECRWYYYRVKPGGFSHAQRARLGRAYLEKTIRIRDAEAQSGNMRYALVRETELTCRLRQLYESCKKAGGRFACRRIRALALRECGRPLFRSVDLFHKGLFYLCFYCWPLYLPFGRALGAIWALKEKGEKAADAGAGPKGGKA